MDNGYENALLKEIDETCKHLYANWSKGVGSKSDLSAILNLFSPAQFELDSKSPMYKVQNKLLSIKALDRLHMQDFWSLYNETNLYDVLKHSMHDPAYFAMASYIYVLKTGEWSLDEIKPIMECWDGELHSRESQDVFNEVSRQIIRRLSIFYG